MMFAEPLVFAVKHKDEMIRAASRSGGIFTAVSDLILDEGGVVYGCVLTEDFHAKHIRAENKEDRNKMRGSKYVQSHMGDTFVSIQKDLNDGRSVLFSGTPCQTAGLRKFLKKEYRELICIDIVCHGVPSKAVWDSYLEWQAGRKHSQVADVDFRNKRDFGWSAHVETIEMTNGSKVDSEVFKNLFYRHEILRPSCYNCRWKNIHRTGDITIGDFWGIDDAVPGFNDNKGVSLVLINSEKGQEIFEKVSDNLIVKRSELEPALQPPLRVQFPRPKDRDQFWSDFESKSFEYIAKKYGDFGTWNKARHKLARVKRKLHL